MKIRIILIGCLLMGTLCSIAQKSSKKAPVNDPEAEKHLAALKSKMEGLSNYAISFNVSVLNPEGKEIEKFSGKHIAEGNKFNIKMDQLDIISNGSTLWNVNNEAKSIQINTLDAKSKNDDNPLDIIFKYKKLYKYRVKEVLENNKIIVELIPLNKNNKIFKVDVTMNVKTLQIISSKLYEKSGVRILYNVTKTDVNQKLPESTFVLKTTSYKGYETTDLR